MEDVVFEGNGPAPASWSTANVSTNSSDMISTNTGDGEVITKRSL